MVDALVSNVIRQLAMIVQQEIQQELGLVVGVEKEVKKLTSTLTKIRAVLKDAEEKQIMNNFVRYWLQDLKEVAYDVDDVLDEWSTAILKQQLELQVHDEHAHRIGPTKKVCLSNLFSPCFCFKRIGLRHDIGHRIKEINGRLDEIASQKDQFGFIRNDDQTSRNCEIIDETSSLIDAREVFGRDMDRDIIISKLLSEDSQQEVVSRVPMIFSIVGMPGVGKTTLAQLAFNDDRVNKNHFIQTMWIHVSKPFDKVKVAMKIIREIGGNIGFHGNSHDIAWESVHRQLTRSINGKKFLLVLDDVWNEDPVLWDPLRLSLQCGSMGSRVLVTTHNKNVAAMMGSTYVHRLEVLSDQHCWSLLSHYAFVGWQKQEYCDKILEEIGMELAKKCKGLPLSAKTLGSLLRAKKSKQDWQYVLDSDLWRVESRLAVLPALLLSYNDLPSHLKQCFAYCSLTPRGYLISRHYMIKEWMAQGFLSDNLEANDKVDLIKEADECFNNLVLRSFFEKEVKISSAKIQYYRMHDLVHDFAKSLVEKECFTLTIKDSNAQEFDFNRARHLYLIMEETEAIPSFIYKAKSVRTLKIFIGQISSVPLELFDHLKCLRTLDLGHCNLKELPNEIDKLIHLRWLSLAEASFEELPKTMTNLYNLRALYLYNCINLCKLPEGIGKLVNLIELDLRECHKLSYLPEGIGKLTKLRSLSNFVIGGMDRGGCKIGELKDLNFLKGSLDIIGLSSVENGEEAKIACLENKQNLRALSFYFHKYTGASLVDEDAMDGEADCIEEEEKEEDKEGEYKEEEKQKEEEEEREEKEAEKQKEEEEREEKEEEEREGKVMDGLNMLSRRTEDVLEGLQPNPSLEKLIIRDYLGVMFPKWMGNYNDFMIFSNLVFVEFYACLRCTQLPPALGKLPSLETLAIGGMGKVKFMDVKFFAIDGATCGDTIFPKLRVLQLSGMRNLRGWDVRVQKEDGKEVIFMPRLQYLVLAFLPKFRSFPQQFTQATSLTKLFIWNCPKLNWMPSPSSHLPFPPIEELILKNDAGSFSRSLVPNNHMFLPKLKLLRVRQSPYSSLPEGLKQLTSLEILDIHTCSKIKSIPEGELQYLTALQELTIMRCPALRRRCQKEKGEDWSKISHIPKIFIDGEKIK